MREGENRVRSGRFGRQASVLALAAAIAACSSDPTDPTGPSAGPPPVSPAASTVIVSNGDSQTAPVGQSVTAAPEVRVTNAQGGPAVGVSVRFAVISGGGSISRPTATTNAQGRASAGTWTLGPQPGTQELRGTVSGVGSVTFTATASAASPPASLSVAGGDGQTAEVATTTSSRPRVRVLDGEANPVPGVTVTFSATSGGGSVTSGSAISNAAGEAEVGSWTLGTTAGPNQLRAEVTGLSPLIFGATAVAGPAASVASLEGDGQSATASTPVAITPTVRVVDAHGNPVPGVGLTFVVTAGGGGAGATAQTTDANGSASVGSWTMGASPGANTLTATVEGVGIAGNPVSFTANGTGAASGGGGFDIQIRFNPGSTPTVSQQAAYDAAEAQWERIITGDLPNTAVNRPAGTCTSATPIDETIDDLVIFVTLEPIDGAGGVLGSAGPCLVRNGTLLPIAGSMRFDTADLADLEAAGLLDEVILHEMGHVLGVGTLWEPLGLLADPASAGGADPHFLGALAIAAFRSVGGSGYGGPEVPVEAGGGPGTEDGHWRETLFDAELMTGWIDAGANPVSLVTVESLGDLGYTVDAGSAEPFSVTASPSIVPRAAGTSPRFKLEGDLLRVSLEVLTVDGRRVGLIPR